MKGYLELLERVVEEGEVRTDRTGTGTRGLFGERLVADLSAGFPLLTTKRMAWRAVVGELLWFLSGETNVGPLREQGIGIWDAWASEEGELGPVYGAQWRHWGGRGIDQIRQVEAAIRSTPDSRRMLVSAWNVSDLERMALPPCHVLFQLHVAGGRLSCQLYQRSADLFIGVPFNLASYALLTCMLAEAAGLGRGRLVMAFGDVHVYEDHLEQVHEQLGRRPYPRPRLVLCPGRTVASIDEIKAGDVVLEGYRHHEAIRGAVAV